MDPTLISPPPGAAIPPPHDTTPRSPGSPHGWFGVGGLGDAALVDAAVEAQVMENASRARRLAAIAEYHHREEIRGGSASPADPSLFLLTPRQATTAEFGPALVVTDYIVELQLDIGLGLMQHFPRWWQMCLSGRLDLGRAQLLLEAVRRFAHAEDIPRFAELMDEFLDKYDDPSSPLCTLTRNQLQNAARYRRGKFEQQSEEQGFAEAFKKRRLSYRPVEDGMGTLNLSGVVTDVMSADYRITLIARQIRNSNPDETRTQEQLRSDVALDLLLGRLEVAASTAELERAVDADGEDEAGEVAGDVPMTFRKTGNYARPVINVTVPITTLLGITEDPGVLSGGTVIPAEVARMIANNPDSTWYRMLTDPARRCVELSTTAYHASPPVWRQCVARDQICLWPTCHRPGVRVELDHREEFPQGATSTANLGPMCKRHHKVKHAKGFEIFANDDGSYTWTTRTGHTWVSRPPEQPVGEWPDRESMATLVISEVGDTFIDDIDAELWMDPTAYDWVSTGPELAPTA